MPNRTKITTDDTDTAAVSRVFGCSIEQARSAYAANAKQLAEMAVKAKRLGKKVNGYTADELASKSTKYLLKA